MESDEIRNALRDADRAEAAPWTDYPPTPWWYPPATGLWAALLTVALGNLDDATPAVLALFVMELVFFRWYTRRRGGVFPTGPAPREFRRAIAMLVAGLGAVAVGTYVLAAVVNVWPGATLALVGVTAVVAWYERAYAGAAGRARRRRA